MSYQIIIPKEDRIRLWGCVRDIIKKHHSEIISKSKNLRDSFYIVRDYLSTDYLKGGKINQRMFDFFVDNSTYSYFIQDIWTQLERESYARPKAKPIGVVIWENYDYTIDMISGYMPQCRGYIYVEKEGIADKLRRISLYGWAIVAAQGQATRQIRDLINRTGKPCLVVHDYDPDGENISESIKNKTRRTKHLDIDLGDKAIDLILNDEQIEFLKDNYDIPTQPLPPKHKGKWRNDYRVELSAFVVVNTKSGNSVLDFVVAEMRRLGLPLSPLPLNKGSLYRDKIKEEMEWQIKSIVEDILRNLKIGGEACKLKFTEEFDITQNESIINAVRETIAGFENKCQWIDEEKIEDELLENVPKRWMER